MKRTPTSPRAWRHRDAPGTPRLGWGGLAATIIGGWWRRVRGRLAPSACPFSIAAILDIPGRRLVAAPESILARFGFTTGDRVLEIGSGTGFYSAAAAKRVGLSGRLICVDVQFEMLLETRRRLEKAGLAAHFVNADGQALPFATGSLDQVFMVGVLGEIPDQNRALAEIERVLHVGGRIGISEQLPDPDFIPRRALRRELSAAGFGEEQTRGRFFYTSTWSKGGASGAPHAASHRGIQARGGVS